MKEVQEQLTHSEAQTSDKEDFVQEVLKDYRLGHISRQASLLGRKEVLTGKAKFGIFGDGKEVPQLAMARSFRAGDFRSGYYRDQTFMFAIGELTVEQFFAQLYAHASVEADPASAGRQMNGHFATRFIDENGDWMNVMARPQSSADVSPTASQMPRLLGLAQASKIYRHHPQLQNEEKFSINGNEVAFGTIGNASSAEGLFWETVNAGGVLMVPMAISIWDDGYGISVPNKYQVTKQNLSELLSGFSYDDEKKQGYHIYTIKGWDYPALVKAYEDGIARVREEHIPAIFHITELTQPQGHSTSGSHERYKSKERLQWEQEYDCLRKMREFILNHELASESELNAIEAEAKDIARTAQRNAWQKFLDEIKEERSELIQLLTEAAGISDQTDKITDIREELSRTLDNDRRINFRMAWAALIALRENPDAVREPIHNWIKRHTKSAEGAYNSQLHSGRALEVKAVAPEYADDAPNLDGREVLNKYFDWLFENNPRVLAFGEDVGNIGDVNQGMAGLQEKFGELRISDTGIREATIVGQGIGMAMRGLRPIAEIQYLDYLLYALQIISDDLATLYYRTKGGQKAPLIVRTRGHRLEGIWHSGSPLGTIINAFRGLYVCAPRNMTQAAGMYNTLMQADEPALIIERLNAYRMKEKLPSNIGEYTVPLGQVDMIKEGTDITVVTYGPNVDIALEAMEKLEEAGISVELIDVQTLLPFDLKGDIVASLKKTNRILFLDEDVPGGSSAYMMQQVIEEQGGYRWLDSAPRTLAAKAHRPAYGTDGDYFSKPNAEEIYRTIYAIMHESDPQKWPMFY